MDVPHSMNTPLIDGIHAFASCTCGWGQWVAGVKLEEIDQDLHYRIPAERAWVELMESL